MGGTGTSDRGVPPTVQDHHHDLRRTIGRWSRLGLSLVSMMLADSRDESPTSQH
jgi:hypothetical protein